MTRYVDKIYGMRIIKVYILVEFSLFKYEFKNPIII